MNEVATRQRVSWGTDVYQVAAIRNALLRSAKKGFCVFVEISYHWLVIKHIKMDFVSIRVFMFTLIYIGIIFVKINAHETVISSGFELSTKGTEGPSLDASIVRAPMRRNQPCPEGEKRGPNGKCRKRWWGEIKIGFFVHLNVLNKLALLCLLSKWTEWWMGREFGLVCPILLSSKLPTGMLNMW